VFSYLPWASVFSYLPWAPVFSSDFLWDPFCSSFFVFSVVLLAFLSLDSRLLIAHGVFSNVYLFCFYLFSASRYVIFLFPTDKCVWQ
jgi:hypothetical protein